VPDLKYPIHVDRRVVVEMEDGVRIALTLYRPASSGDGPFPTILESLPYRKDDDCTARDWTTYAYLASQGFAGVRIDIRGTGASTGIIENEYTGQEQADNLSVMRWLAAQDWCSGNLGMWGISWGGFSSLQTAMLQPPELKANVPMHATHDRYACDVHYTGGSLHAAEQVDWPTSMVATNGLPPDPDIVGNHWFEEWVERLENTPQWPFEWLRHQTRDGYWLHGSPCADYQSIKCPTLLIGGWLDGYVDGMLDLAEKLDCPTRAVIGPWGHYRPATGVPGPTLDHLDLMARWFGHHLRGDDNGIMSLPEAAVFVRTAAPYDGDLVEGHWRAEPQWPPLDRALWVADLSDLDHDTVSWSGPQWVGAHAPAWDRAGIGSRLGVEDDAHSVTFQTSPLTEALEILGVPEVELAVTSDQSVGMVAARLSAVSPEGVPHLICRGNRNMAFPEDLSQPVPFESGAEVLVRIPLLASSAVIQPGWSIRVSIAGADFPVVWPPGRRFQLTVDPAASRLTLPTVPPRPVEQNLDWGESPDPPRPNVIMLSDERDWEITSGDGLTTYRRQIASTEEQPDRAELRYESQQRWEVSVTDNDPASTRVWSVNEIHLDRPGWSVGTIGTLDLSGDADSFLLRVELKAMNDGAQFWQRVWEERIPREWS
jgi:predicted acyl esterase